MVAVTEPGPSLVGIVDTTGDGPALIGARCESCGTHTFPPQPSCPCCGKRQMVELRLPTSGTVWTFTVQRLAPKPPYRGPDPFEPFAVGYVDLGPLRVEGRLDGRPLDEWSIGDEVNLAVELLPGEDPNAADARRSYVFRPRQGAHQ